LATICILAGTLVTGGCATKKYVRNTVAPVTSKVDQVADQTNKNSQGIEDTRNQVKQVDEKAQTGISAAQERASAADAHAGEASNRADKAQQSANTAQQAADKNRQDLGGLRDVMTNAIANIDDYKLQTTVSVSFKFNHYRLDDQSRQELDKLVGDVKSDKRYFISVEGFTDRTGSKEYNEALSRRRADAVVQYLVAQHDIPIYRIHMIGLGDQKPLDDAHNREARAKNRRVEVKVFSADQVAAGLEKGRSSQNSPQSTSGVQAAAAPSK
jgi:outer membrane protein OmpA-like peptidoglycan-associated protein